MRHIVYLLTSQSVTAPTTTARQLTTRFKAATGLKLVMNKQKSSASHYRAYDGAASKKTDASWKRLHAALVVATR